MSNNLFEAGVKLYLVESLGGDPFETKALIADLQKNGCKEIDFTPMLKGYEAAELSERFKKRVTELKKQKAKSPKKGRDRSD